MTRAEPPNGRLADYLRTRRERLTPADVGLAPGTGKRRVVGLRREEVAILAGISTDYYLRLEQGRDTNPSGQVLDALARALQLDPVARNYLHGLTRLPGQAGDAVDRGDLVSDETRWLIDSWPLTAAIVHNRYLDVLASNKLARALNPNYRPGVNSVVSLLTDSSEQAFHRDWEALSARTVALLRNLADTRGGDERLDALVAKGTAGSRLFREFWDRQDVTRPGNGVHPLRHPEAGELTLSFFRVSLVGSDGQSLFLYFAPPGSPSERVLTRLASPGWERGGQGGIPAEV